MPYPIPSQWISAISSIIIFLILLGIVITVWFLQDLRKDIICAFLSKSSRQWLPKSVFWNWFLLFPLFTRLLVYLLFPYDKLENMGMMTKEEEDVKNWSEFHFPCWLWSCKKGAYGERIWNSFLVLTLMEGRGTRSENVPFCGRIIIFDSFLFSWPLLCDVTILSCFQEEHRKGLLFYFNTFIFCFLWFHPFLYPSFSICWMLSLFILSRNIGTSH